MVGLLRP